MTRRAANSRFITLPDGNQMQYSMEMMWKETMGKVVTVAGTKYLVKEDGWRKVK
jgi:hypothetical protein